MNAPAPAYTPSSCRSCGAPIIWAITVNGKPQPFDAMPHEDGNALLEERNITRDGHVHVELHARSSDPLFDAGKPIYMPHHATCEHADQWRRR